MLSERQKKILEVVVKEYTRTAEPIGSEELLKRYGFQVSPATIRAEMAELDRQGFLYQPHTSAGRIPTDKGYRYFVSGLMENRALSWKEQKVLQEELLKEKARNVRLARTTAKLLAALSQNLAISGFIEEEEYFQSGIKSLLLEPEFSDIDEICKVVEMLDYLDENIDRLVAKLRDGEVQTLIGKENPLTGGQDIGCSMVVSRCKVSGGKTGILAIMGPKRMKYAKNISLIKYVTNLLGGRQDN